MTAAKAVCDRNLLVGILALQMDFIDRDQLLAAMNRWILEKNRGIDEILLEQAVLDEDERSLLSALVAKHLEKHDQNPERSLAAVSAVASSVRANLEAIGDADVEASLVCVAVAESPPSEFASTLSLKETLAGQRFRVLRPHAKGGLGEVFVANDGELNREVALKQIQASHADNPQSRARFLLEAELTGGLEHPGIVPVYGLGQYSDGRPFYAMRFIRGDSLRDAIHRFHATRTQWSAGEQSLQLRKLLGRFIDVCDAVEYAHTRGVLHRDLKPGNVMLGRHGETLVVDWGLAKAFERDEPVGDEPQLRPATGSGTTPTQLGSALGTPSYMSPEQAAGRIDLLDARSDTYSLGATLYALLTGRAPVKEDNVAATLSCVQRGEFPPPRQIAPYVPRTLEAICLKSMALQPDQRYATPRALAEDLEHWLADEPVAAHPDPIVSRAARWGRRHKAAVAAVTMLLLTAVVGLSIGAILLTAANQRITAARELAEENERVANENFRLARRAVQDYLTDVSQETLFNEPGMQPLRRKLLNDALVYYQEFVRQRGDDPNAQLDLADAHFLVGSITDQIGSPQEALKAYRRAAAINEALLKESPSSIDLKLTLSRCYNATGSSLFRAGRLDEAWEAFVEAAVLLETVIDEASEDVAVVAWDELRGIYSSQGSLRSDQGRFHDALKLYQQAYEIGERLAGGDDPGGQYRNSSAGIQHNLASLYRETGDLDASVKNYLSAIETRERLVREFDSVQLYREKLAVSYNNLANAYGQMGRTGEAGDLHQKATRIRERLARENPAVTRYQDSLAGSYSNLSTRFRRLGDLDQAIEFSAKATAIWRHLAEQYPSIVQYRMSLANILYNRGNFFLGDATTLVDVPLEVIQQRARSALQEYAESIRVYEALVDEFPDVPAYRASLATVYNNGSSAHSLLEDDEHASQMNRKALSLQEELVARHPDVPLYQNQLASTSSNAAGYEDDEQKKSELLDRSISLRETLVEAHPEVPDYRYSLAYSLQIRALKLFLDGQPDQALPLFRRVIELMDRLHGEFPDVANYRNMLFEALKLYATGQRLADDWQGAVETQQRAATLHQAALARDPDNLALAVGLARNLHDIGKGYHKGMSYPEALDQYTQAIELLQPLVERDPPVGSAQIVMRDVLRYRTLVFEKQERYAAAAGDAARIADMSDNSVEWRLKKTRFDALAGNYETATSETAQWLVDIQETSDLYNAACVFSLAAAAARIDTDLAADRRQALVGQYVQQTINCLSAARDAGYFADEKTVEHLSKDSDLDGVRGEDAFIAFIENLKYP